MPTIYEMSEHLLQLNFFIGGLTDEAIVYYYNQVMSRQ